MAVLKQTFLKYHFRCIDLMYYAFECECGNILCQAQNKQDFLFRFTIFFLFESVCKRTAGWTSEPPEWR